MRRALAGVLDFVVGDDVRTALVVVLAVVATALVVHAGLDAWWLLPVAVPLAVLRSVTVEGKRTGPRARAPREVS